MSTQIEKLKKRIPYDVDIFNTTEIYNDVLNTLLEDSKIKCLSILYPYTKDFDDIELPKRFENWQLRASVELYNLADKAGIVNYSENGIVWSKLSDGLSFSLLNEITPKVGVPKKQESVN